MGVLKARVGTTWEPVMGAQYTSPGNAIGVVAIGSFKAGIDGNSQPTGTTITNTLTYTGLVGRRYRIRITVRAATVGGYIYVLIDGSQSHDSHFTYGTGNAYVRSEFLFDGDGASHTYNFAMACAGSFTAYTGMATSHWYIEDVGPNSSPPLTLPVTAPAWTPMTLINGWSNYNIAAYVGAQYRKIGDNVEVRGLIKGGSLNTSCALFPVGFRPPLNQHFPIIANDLIGTARMEYGGNLYVNAATNTWLSLDTVRFSVTP